MTDSTIAGGRALRCPNRAADCDLGALARKRVGARGLSGFVARALAHELEREGVRTLLAELENTLGPPSKADLARVRKAWPKR